MNEQSTKRPSTPTYIFIAISFLILAGLSEALITSGGGQTTISYTLPNAQAVEVADAFAWAYNYKATLCTFNQTTMSETCTPNPQTKSSFTNEHIKKYVKDVVVAYRQSQLSTTVNTTVSVN
jgi:hypothetical protein